MTTVAIGKARLRIEIKGCIDCGTENACGWTTAREVFISYGAHKSVRVDVHRCMKCADQLHLHQSAKSADKKERVQG